MDGGGYPDPALDEGGYPDPALDEGGYPDPALDGGGYTNPALDRGVPQPWMGEYPNLGWRGTPSPGGYPRYPPPGIASTCYGYAVGGVPLAFTQEDFLVIHGLDNKLPFSSFGKILSVLFKLL